MNSSPLKSAALALVAAGLLIGVGMLIHPDDDDPASVTMSLWGTAHWLITVGAVLGLFGLTGLFATWLQTDGTLGLLAYVLTSVGMTLIVAFALFEAAVVAPIASLPEAAALLEEAGPIFGGPLGLVFLVTIAALGIGTLLLGFLLYRGRHVPPAAAMMVAVGGPLLSVSDWLPYVLDVASGVLLGLGLAWVGWVLWQRQTAAA